MELRTIPDWTKTIFVRPKRTDVNEEMGEKITKMKGSTHIAKGVEKVERYCEKCK